MNDKRRTHLSKFLSKHLRHTPEDLGLTLEPGGWVPISEVIEGAARAGLPFTREDLDEVVHSSDKQRFAFDEAGTKIRANQGHSTEVDLQFEPAEPPAVLYHGTPERNVESILRDGILKMARHHVHLSADTMTASKVGERRGKAVILVVDTAAMRTDGCVFFRSANGVWLVDRVPPEYLRVLGTDA